MNTGIGMPATPWELNSRLSLTQTVCTALLWLSQGRDTSWTGRVGRGRTAGCQSACCPRGEAWVSRLAESPFTAGQLPIYICLTFGGEGPGPLLQNEGSGQVAVLPESEEAGVAASQWLCPKRPAGMRKAPAPEPSLCRSQEPERISQLQAQECLA